ncbi:hypothetical protein D3C76_891110 [compost metagenome]
MFTEVGHLDVLQVALIDQVVGRDGVAQKDVGLIERHGVQCVLVGGVGRDGGVRVIGQYLIHWQVVIDHAQAQACQAGVQGADFVLAGHQYRLIHGIGDGQGDAGRGCLVAVGAAQQVDLALSQGFHRLLAGGVALHPDRQAQGRADQAGEVGGQAFVVAPAGGHVEGRVIRRRSSQQ